MFKLVFEDKTYELPETTAEMTLEKGIKAQKLIWGLPYLDLYDCIRVISILADIPINILKNVDQFQIADISDRIPYMNDMIWLKEDWNKFKIDRQVIKIKPFIEFNVLEFSDVHYFLSLNENLYLNLDKILAKIILNDETKTSEISKSIMFDQAESFLYEFLKFDKWLSESFFGNEDENDKKEVGGINGKWGGGLYSCVYDVAGGDIRYMDILWKKNILEFYKYVAFANDKAKKKMLNQLHQ
jgi:hypothetical protein